MSTKKPKLEKMMSVVMSKQLIKRIRAIAQQEQRPFSPTCRILLEEALAARAAKS